MNLLISKYDKVDNNSEVESLIFELHSLKNKKFNGNNSTVEGRKQSVPNVLDIESPFKPLQVPKKLQKKIHNFMETVDFDKGIGKTPKNIRNKLPKESSSTLKTTQASLSRTINADLLNLKDDSVLDQRKASASKCVPDKSLPPTIKYIYQDLDFYHDYQALCLEYEEAFAKVSLNSIKSFLSVKNPNKLEHNMGIVLVYLASFLDSAIMLGSDKDMSTETDFIMRTKSWTAVVSSLKKMSSKKLYKYLKKARTEMETYPLGIRVV